MLCGRAPDSPRSITTAAAAGRLVCSVSSGIDRDRGSVLMREAPRVAIGSGGLSGSGSPRGDDQTGYRMGIPPNLKRKEAR
jgi:hypothetical protein